LKRSRRRKMASNSKKLLAMLMRVLLVIAVLVLLATSETDANSLGLEQCTGTLSKDYTLYMYTSQESQQYNARCLDGTPAGFYVACGSGAGASKLLIFLNGGGYCLPDPPSSNIPPCSDRVQTKLGSSKYWAKTLPAPTRAGGSILSTDAGDNPDFYDWNKIIVPYCTGDLHSGQRNESDTNGFYFSGHLNIAALISKIASLGALQKLDGIILSGSSAGGLGTHINIDYVARTVAAYNSSIEVVAFPQAGWFIGVYPYPGSNVVSIEEASIILAQTANTYVNQECSAAYGGTPGNGWLCMSANISYPYWGVRSFVAENVFDVNQLFVEDGFPEEQSPPNATQCDYLGYFGDWMLHTLQEVIDAPGNQSGIFAPKCFNHPLAWTGVTVPASGGVTLQSLFGDWYFSRQPLASNYKAVDPCVGIGCNPTCTNLYDAQSCN